MSSIITIISLLFLLASFSVQAISDDPHYNVIFRQQGLENSNAIHDRKQVIMAFENDKFTCLLPNESNEKKKARKTVQEYVELLKPFKRCLYYSHHYWTYEYCHNKHVRQFHVENVNGELTETISYLLGVYDGSQQVELDDENKLSHLWSEGSICDITGQPRGAEIIYECSQDTVNQEDRLLSFKEVHTCQYQITIATPRLCVHPSQAHRIECFPLIKSAQKVT